MLVQRERILPDICWIMYLYYRDKLQVMLLLGVLGFRKLHRVQTIEPQIK